MLTRHVRWTWRSRTRASMRDQCTAMHCTSTVTRQCPAAPTAAAAATAVVCRSTSFTYFCCLPEHLVAQHPGALDLRPELAGVHCPFLAQRLRIVIIGSVAAAQDRAQARRVLGLRGQELARVPAFRLINRYGDPRQGGSTRCRARPRSARPRSKRVRVAVQSAVALARESTHLHPPAACHRHRSP